MGKMVFSLFTRNFIVKFTFFTFIFILSSFLFYNQTFSDGSSYPSDIPIHLGITKKALVNQNIGSTHTGFHTSINLLFLLSGISQEYSAILILSLSVLFIALIIYKILLKFLRNYYSDCYLLLITALLLLLSSIYIPFFNKNLYSGQGSPNIWHSPTTIMVKPFIFIVFMLFMSFFEDSKKVRFYILIPVILLITLWIKPNFVISFIPALFIFLIIRYFKRYDLYLKTFLLILPSIILLFYQFSLLNPEGHTKFVINKHTLMVIENKISSEKLEGIKSIPGITFSIPGDPTSPPDITYRREELVEHLKKLNFTQEEINLVLSYSRSKIIFDFLGVWRSKSPNVLISFLLLTAFPVSLFFIRFKESINNDYLILSWINFSVASLQFICFAEQGLRYYHGNFGWGRALAIQLVFIFSVIEFFKWLKAGSGKMDKLEILKFSIPLILLLLHLVSGIYYLLKILSGGYYN